MASDLTILHVDDHYVAVDKPAGLLVHRGGMADRREEALVQRLRDQIGAWVYPVHRLDRPTSGVIVFGRSSDAAARLAGVFAAHRVDKRYLAVVRGYAPEVALVESPVRDGDEPGAPLRDARTELWRCALVEVPIAVGRYPSARYSLVELRPHGGRWRQLRQHCAHLRHPILGDTTHGEGRHNRLFRDHFATSRLLLHAARLTYEDPYSGALRALEAGPDEAWTQLLARLGWAWPRLLEDRPLLAPATSDRPTEG